MAGTRTKRSVVTAMAMLSVLAGLGCCSEESQQTAREKGQSDREAKGAKSLAASVSVLPPGTEEAWLAYVDRRIAATMKREGSAVQVNPFGIDDYKNYISINMPYKISCFGGTIIIDFIDGIWRSGGEGGDDADTVMISGLPDMGQPPLGVDPTSIAARKLNEALCRKVSDRVQAIMSPDSANPIQK